MSSQTRTATGKFFIRALALEDVDTIVPPDRPALTMLAAFCYKNCSCSARN